MSDEVSQLVEQFFLLVAQLCKHIDTGAMFSSQLGTVPWYLWLTLPQSNLSDSFGPHLWEHTKAMYLIEQKSFVQ